MVLTFLVVLAYFMATDSHKTYFGVSALSIGCAYSAGSFVSVSINHITLNNSYQFLNENFVHVMKTSIIIAERNKNTEDKNALQRGKAIIISRGKNPLHQPNNKNSTHSTQRTHIRLVTLKNTNRQAGPIKINVEKIQIFSPVLHLLYRKKKNVHLPFWNSMSMPWLCVAIDYAA